MSFSPQRLIQTLRSLEQLAPAPNRYVIALSGGLDSTVLLHALATTKREHGRGLLAVHVNHQLQAESGDWAAFCASTARDLDVEFVAIPVTVDLGAGRGPEAAARRARYDALAAGIEPDDWILSAHHRDDQAETLLLNLLRGSGPLGVAGIPAARPLGEGWLIRPLLESSRDQHLAYAKSVGLRWIEDPSNEDTRYDRNFLRNDVLPLLQTRWPDVSARLASSAGLARNAADLLDELAASDLRALGGNPAQLPVDGFARLPRARQQNLLRYAARVSGLPPPLAAHVDEVLAQMTTAREDASPLVEWPGAQVRRFRDAIYLMSDVPRLDLAAGAALTREPLPLGPGLGRLSLSEVGGTGLSPRIVSHGLTVRMRQGGEEIKPAGQAHTRKLKKLLQEAAVVPWLRDQLPLVYAGDDLVAVGDLWVAADAAADDGLSIAWEGRPDLY